MPIDRGAVSKYGTDLAGTAANRPTKAPAGVTWVATDTGEFSVSVGGAGWMPLAGGRALNWVAGERGKPGLNADIQASGESTRMVANAEFEIVGTNATSALCTYNAEGGLTLTTAGADGDMEILAPHLDANQSAWTQWTWGTDKSVCWSGRFQSGANITNAIIWAGLKLTNTSVAATDNNQVFVRYEDDVASGVWQVIDSIAGTDVTTSTDITVAVSTDYEVLIVIDSSRIARVWINGTLVRTTTALTDTTDLIPYIGVEADGASAAKAITVYGQSISRAA